MLSASNKAQIVESLQVRLILFRISYHKSAVFTHCTTVRQIIWSMQSMKYFIEVLLPTSPSSAPYIVLDVVYKCTRPNYI